MATGSFRKNRPTSHFHVGMDAVARIPGIAAISDDLTGCDKSLCEITVFQMGKSPIKVFPIVISADELNVAAITLTPYINLPPSLIIKTTEQGIDRVAQLALKVDSMVRLCASNPHRFRPRCAV